MGELLKGVLNDLCTHNFMYAKISFCTCCMHVHHHTHNLLNPVLIMVNLVEPTKRLKSFDFLESAVPLVTLLLLILDRQSTEFLLNCKNFINFLVGQHSVNPDTPPYL